MSVLAFSWWCFIVLLAGCYLSFPANKLVSGEHCKIVQDASSGLVWLEDMRYLIINGFIIDYLLCLFYFAFAIYIKHILLAVPISMMCITNAGNAHLNWTLVVCMWNNMEYLSYFFVSALMAPWSTCPNWWRSKRTCCRTVMSSILHTGKVSQNKVSCL